MGVSLGHPRYGVEDTADMDRESFAAALQSLVPPKLPALRTDVPPPRVRQRLLMRGHTSYLTFCTLFRKDSPAVRALFEEPPVASEAPAPADATLEGGAK